MARCPDCNNWRARSGPGLCRSCRTRRNEAERLERTAAEDAVLLSQWADGATYAAIAAERNVTRERARQLVHKALRREEARMKYPWSKPSEIIDTTAPV